MKKTFAELSQQRMAANEKLGNLYEGAKNRELNDEEKIREINLTREIRQCEDAMRALNLEADNAKVVAQREKANKGAHLREILADLRQGKGEREITLAPPTDNATQNIDASGAINLTIHDMIPTLHEGLGLPAGLRVVTGVIGNEVWPVSINDVEMEETGENTPLNDQVLDFAKIVPVSRRIGLTVPVSNRAIDNAAFDLMAFVQTKFTIAMRKYLAKKIYSKENWSGNKGPFAGLTPGTIELGADAYKNILAKVAEFSNKGFFEGNVCLCMDRVTEAELKATPKIAGAAGGFVIENGKCAGYDYVVSHYVGTEYDSTGALEPSSDRFIEIGYFEFFALQLHDNVRLTIDATSQAVAKKNITAITMNLACSMTDLSKYINGADNTTQAFGIYKVTESTPTTV